MELVIYPIPVNEARSSCHKGFVKVGEKGVGGRSIWADSELVIKASHFKKIKGDIFMQLCVGSLN